VNDDLEMIESKMSGWLLQGFVDTHQHFIRNGHCTCSVRCYWLYSSWIT